MKPQGSRRQSSIIVALVLASISGQPLCAQSRSQLQPPEAGLTASQIGSARSNSIVVQRPKHLEPPPSSAHAQASEVQISTVNARTDAGHRVPVLSDLRQPPRINQASRSQTAKVLASAKMHAASAKNVQEGTLYNSPLLRTFREVYGQPSDKVGSARHALPTPPRRTSLFSMVSLSTPEPMQQQVESQAEQAAVALPASPFSFDSFESEVQTVNQPFSGLNSDRDVLSSSIAAPKPDVSSAESGAAIDSGATHHPESITVDAPTPMPSEDSSPSDLVNQLQSQVESQPAQVAQPHADATGTAESTPPDVQAESGTFVSTAPVIGFDAEQTFAPPTGTNVPDSPFPSPTVPNPIASISEIADGTAQQSPLPPLLHPTPTAPVELKRPYWSDEELAPFGQPQVARQYQLDELVLLSMQNSPHVLSVLIDPQIAHMRINESAGVFDPKTFVDSIFHDTSDPVGNTLTTGGPPRLNEHRFEGKGGLRKRSTRGGQLEVSQQYKTLDNNSLFLVPRQQSDSKLVMNYTQPLWRGAGRAYNQSNIVIARLEQGATAQDVTRKLQSHVYSITQAYWELFYARALFLQSHRGIKRLETLHALLVGREDLDSLRSQVLNVETSIGQQVNQLTSARSAIQQSQAQLRALVNAPEMCSGAVWEIIPSTPSVDMQLPIDVQFEIDSALTYHPEIQSIRERVAVTKTKLCVAENDLRPTLNLVMDAYVRGLAGDYNFGSSFSDQFSQGAPSYSIGLQHDRSYRNTIQKAILRIQRLELQKIMHQLSQTLLDVRTEVDTSTARIQRAFAELEASVQATIYSEEDVQFTSDRLRNSIVDNTQPIILVDQLLNAQVRMIQSENRWARAQADYMIALANLRLATGTLFTVASPEILPPPTAVHSAQE